MMTEKEIVGMEQAKWTVRRLNRMRREGLTADEVTQLEIDEATARILAETLRVEANAAMNRVLKAGGVIADLFEELYSIQYGSCQTGAAVAKSIILLCEERIKEANRANELKLKRKYED